MVKTINHIVYVKVATVEEMSKGGIYIPEETRIGEQIASCEGTIVNIGPLAIFEMQKGDEPLRVGDKVIFSKFSGIGRHDKDDPDSKALYRLLTDADIVAVIR